MSLKAVTTAFHLFDDLVRVVAHVTVRRALLFS